MRFDQVVNKGLIQEAHRMRNEKFAEGTRGCY
jgi:hypothetical protein